MQVDEALSEMQTARQAVLEAKRQFTLIYDSLEGAYAPGTDQPLDEEARVRSAAALALDELGHVLHPIERILRPEEAKNVEGIDLEDGVRSALLEEMLMRRRAER